MKKGMSRARHPDSCLFDQGTAEGGFNPPSAKTKGCVHTFGVVKREKSKYHYIYLQLNDNDFQLFLLPILGINHIDF